jgi:hypothetical protein
MLGSNVNQAYANTGWPAPEVGMGATQLLWTDRHPYTIIEVSKSGKQFLMRSDKAIRTDDRGYFTESQSYRYEPDPSGHVTLVRLCRDGRWREVSFERRYDVERVVPAVDERRGRAVGTVVAVGMRKEYRDPHF